MAKSKTVGTPSDGARKFAQVGTHLAGIQRLGVRYLSPERIEIKAFDFNMPLPQGYRDPTEAEASFYRAKLGLAAKKSKVKVGEAEPSLQPHIATSDIFIDEGQRKRVEISGDASRTSPMFSYSRDLASEDRCLPIAPWGMVADASEPLTLTHLTHDEAAMLIDLSNIGAGGVCQDRTTAGLFRTIVDLRRLQLIIRTLEEKDKSGAYVYTDERIASDARRMAIITDLKMHPLVLGDSRTDRSMKVQDESLGIQKEGVDVSKEGLDISWKTLWISLLGTGVIAVGIFGGHRLLRYIRFRSAIKKYGTDLTLEARQGRLKPYIGGEQVLREIVAGLAAPEYPGVLVTADPGLGKTATWGELARRVATGDMPNMWLETAPFLRDAEIYMIDLGKIVADGTEYRGEFEAKFRPIIDEAERTGVRRWLGLRRARNMILIFDEGHNLASAGAAGGRSDGERTPGAIEQLKKPLERGRAHIAISTTTDESGQLLRDGAIFSRLRRVSVRPPTPEQMHQILLKWRSDLEGKLGIKIEEGVIDEILRLPPMVDEQGRQESDPRKSVKILTGLPAEVMIRTGERTITVTDAKGYLDEYVRMYGADSPDRQHERVLRQINSPEFASLFLGIPQKLRQEFAGQVLSEWHTLLRTRADIATDFQARDAHLGSRGHIIPDSFIRARIPVVHDMIRRERETYAQAARESDRSAANPNSTRLLPPHVETGPQKALDAPKDGAGPAAKPSGAKRVVVDALGEAPVALPRVNPDGTLSVVAVPGFGFGKIFSGGTVDPGFLPRAAGQFAKGGLVFFAGPAIYDLASGNWENLRRKSMLELVRDYGSFSLGAGAGTVAMESHVIPRLGLNPKAGIGKFGSKYVPLFAAITALEFASKGAGNFDATEYGLSLVNGALAVGMVDSSVAVLSEFKWAQKAAAAARLVLVGGALGAPETGGATLLGSIAVTAAITAVGAGLSWAELKIRKYSIESGLQSKYDDALGSYMLLLDRVSRGDASISVGEFTDARNTFMGAAASWKQYYENSREAARKYAEGQRQELESKKSELGAVSESTPYELAGLTGNVFGDGMASLGAAYGVALVARKAQLEFEFSAVDAELAGNLSDIEAESNARLVGIAETEAQVAVAEGRISGPRVEAAPVVVATPKTLAAGKARTTSVIVGGMQDGDTTSAAIALSGAGQLIGAGGAGAGTSTMITARTGAAAFIAGPRSAPVRPVRSIVMPPPVRAVVH